MNLHSDHVAYGEEEPTEFDLAHQAGGYDLTLRVVALEQVVPHEHYHERRVAELAARLALDGRLINPPIVAQYSDQYVVLDGATRLTALRHLGYPYIVVQVVEITPQRVQLGSWNHVVFGGSTSDLLDRLGAVPDLRIMPADAEAIRQGLPDGALAHLVTADRTGYRLESQPPVAAFELGWLHHLNAVVESYGQWGNVERTLSQDIEQVAAQFPDLAALVIFPRFSPQTLLGLASQGRTVPAGITRFVIAGRILRLNAPLALLRADEPLAAKQAWLDDFIRTKLLDRQVRIYEEPVILLDE